MSWAPDGDDQPEARAEPQGRHDRGDRRRQDHPSDDGDRAEAEGAGRVDLQRVHGAHAAAGAEQERPDAGDGDEEDLHGALRCRRARWPRGRAPRRGRGAGSRRRCGWPGPPSARVRRRCRWGCRWRWPPAGPGARPARCSRWPTPCRRRPPRSRSAPRISPVEGTLVVGSRPTARIPSKASTRAASPAHAWSVRRTGRGACQSARKASAESGFSSMTPTSTSRSAHASQAAASSVVSIGASEIAPARSSGDLGDRRDHRADLVVVGERVLAGLVDRGTESSTTSALSAMNCSEASERRDRRRRRQPLRDRHQRDRRRRGSSVMVTKGSVEMIASTRPAAERLGHVGEGDLDELDARGVDAGLGPATP